MVICWLTALRAYIMQNLFFWGFNHVLMFKCQPTSWCAPHGDFYDVFVFSNFCFALHFPSLVYKRWKCVRPAEFLFKTMHSMHNNSKLYYEYHIKIIFYTGKFVHIINYYSKVWGHLILLFNNLVDAWWSHFPLTSGQRLKATPPSCIFGEEAISWYSVCNEVASAVTRF